MGFGQPTQRVCARTAVLRRPSDRGRGRVGLAPAAVKQLVELHRSGFEVELQRLAGRQPIDQRSESLSDLPLRFTAHDFGVLD